MDFEIQNVLQKSNLKKFAMPAIFIVAGVVIIAMIKNKSTAGTTATASGATAEAAGASNDGIDSAIQQLNASISATNKNSQDSITSLEKSVASIIAEDKSYNNEQLKNLSSQLVSYQDSTGRQISDLISQLNKQIADKVSNPVYTPSSPSYTPSYSGGGSSNYVNDSTPSYPDDTPSTPIPEGNPYNANPSTGDYNYGGVDYSAYDGSEKWNGTPEEAAYWNNFINS